jgi:hypothetical protein
VLKSKFLEQAASLLVRDFEAQSEKYQFSAIEAKFIAELEPISSIFVDRLKKRILKSKEIEGWMGSRIRYAVLEAIHALFEGNSPYIEHISKSISTSYLKFKILSVYEEFQRMGKPLDEEQFAILAEDDVRQEFILMLGFKAFFLLKSYELVLGTLLEHQQLQPEIDLKSKFANEMTRRQRAAYEFF